MAEWSGWAGLALFLSLLGLVSQGTALVWSGILYHSVDSQSLMVFRQVLGDGETFFIDEQ